MLFPPWLVDLVLALIAVEAIAFTFVLRRRRPRAIKPFLLFLGSGAALVVSVRAALLDGPGALIGAGLLTAGILHALSLRNAAKILAQTDET